MIVNFEAVEEEKVPPLKVTFKLETKEEMMMLAAVFNTPLIHEAGGLGCGGATEKIKSTIEEHLRKNGISTSYGWFGSDIKIPDWAKK